MIEQETIEAYFSGEMEEDVAIKMISKQPMAFHRAVKKYFANLDIRDRSYNYMLTYTIDPKKHPDITTELVTKIEGYIEGIAERKALKLIQFEYVKELHKDGRPHWHCLLTSKKALKKSMFIYYQKIYGHLDFSSTRGKTDQYIKEYISKDNTPKQLI